ncbi:Cupredoxin-like domain-containing protein [Parageobacillus thermantarcticus]|uniref:Cupredoxin-like domain-containing protein n=1 Tax=Parageobacillus thermantarcticus TaxID=186116 RepID=A0A1I0TD17_9BACL|nr:cupredoxin domain-containing protein [Parageobacillus thermantarcticus]SFA49651.1 Cupredoxin-like domain-containing protein [Parageobacillus thermantarcticus]
MDMTPIIVNVSGLLLIVFIAWFFWGPKKGGYKATLTPSGYQEAEIIVKGGYTPHIVVVKKGKPVKFQFIRKEENSCSEMVVFPEFNKSAVLPVGEKVTVEFLPKESGEYSFQCQMGMYRGKVIVQD